MTAAAREVLSITLQILHLTEVFAFAVVGNQRSIRVMERLGMERYSPSASNLEQNRMSSILDNLFVIYVAFTSKILDMSDLQGMGRQISQARREKALTQVQLSSLAGLSRATIAALENGRVKDIGFSRLTRLLHVLGLEVAVRPAGRHRPTLHELLEGDQDAED